MTSTATLAPGRTFRAAGCTHTAATVTRTQTRRGVEVVVTTTEGATFRTLA